MMPKPTLKHLNANVLLFITVVPLGWWVVRAMFAVLS